MHSQQKSRSEFILRIPSLITLNASVRIFIDFYAFIYLFIYFCMCAILVQGIFGLTSTFRQSRRCAKWEILEHPVLIRMASLNPSTQGSEIYVEKDMGNFKSQRWWIIPEFSRHNRTEAPTMSQKLTKCTEPTHPRLMRFQSWEGEVNIASHP